MDKDKIDNDIFNVAEKKVFIQVTPEDLKAAFNKWYNELSFNTPTITQEDDDILLTASEVCDMLHISQPTLWRWHRDKILQKKKIGGHIYYRKKDVNNIIKK